MKIDRELDVIMRVPLYGTHLAFRLLTEEKTLSVKDRYVYTDSELEQVVHYGITTTNYNYNKDNAYYKCVTIALNTSYFEGISHGVIAHEALHATNMILSDAGISFSNESEEAFSHLLSWVVNSIYSVLKSKDLLKELNTTNN
jgi:hypothetical protein